MYAFLTLYWLIFWQKFLRNPFLLCTSEIGSTYFPFWISMGRRWKPVDKIYYKYPAGIPFLSMFYLPSVLMSKLTRFMSLEDSFRLFVYFLLGHYLLGSFLAFKAWGLFGALTYMYAGYCIKPQTPAFVYTICWVPGFFVYSRFKALFLGMALLGGYWPIMVYVMPLCLILEPVGTVFGLFTAFPQVIPFIWYWKRSVRCGEKVDRNIGKLPWFKLKDLFWTSNSVGLVNGVHYPEAEMYMGCTVALSFLSFQIGLYPFLGCTVLLLLGVIPPVQRISMRAIYLLSILLTILACRNIEILNHKGIPTAMVIVLQAYLLLRNSNIYPSFPFSQWWKKPSEFYPHGDYTGYLLNKKINDYKGAFSLKAA